MITKQQIIDIFGAKTLRKSALNLPYGAETFTEILQNKQYSTIIEIGTYRGVTAAFMSQFCDKLITIDLKNGQLIDTTSRKQLWDALKINNIEMLEINNDKEKRLFLEKTDFDFAFIDGAHDYTVSRDFAWTKKCGTVLFHDYDDRGQPDLNSVKDFVDTLPADELTFYPTFALWRKNE